MIIGRAIRNRFKWPSLGLEAKPINCLHCRACTESCPTGLPVQVMVSNNRMEHRECILWGMCADRCGERAISLLMRQRHPTERAEESVKTAPSKWSISRGQFRLSAEARARGILWSNHRIGRRRLCPLPQDTSLRKGQ
ncbi:MAG: 4Fe-4S dicluster domain-containing protein [Deltaproteobacteria bacterium]